MFKKIKNTRYDKKQAYQMKINDKKDENRKT